MGQQLSCGNLEKASIDSRFTIIHTFRNSVKENRSSYKNICKEMGIGQYMDHDSEQKVDRMWKELYGIAKLLKIQEEEGIETIDFREKYAFVITESDELITSIWMLDRKGFFYISSLGPPPEMRWSCWKVMLLTDMELIDYENQLCQLNDSALQISLDVQRTLVTHKFFQKQNLGQKQLLRLLNAISIRLPKLGYCQGMNFLVGFLLMISGCDERTSFNAFIQLLTHPKYLFYYIYCPGLPFYHFLSYLTHQILKERDRQLFDHLQAQNIPDSFWLTKMIISLFLYILPTQQCIRIWDYIISYGFIGLLQIIQSILNSIRIDMLNSDVEAIGMMFQGQLNKKEIEVEKTIQYARQNRISPALIVKFANLYKSDNDFHVMFTYYDNSKVFEKKVNEYNGINF